MKSYLAFPLILSTSLTSLSSADSIRGLVKSWRCNHDGQALAKSTVDRLPWLQCVTLVRSVMDLSELDGGGCTEGSRRYGEDEGEGGNEVVK